MGVIGSRDFNDSLLLDKWITYCVFYYKINMIISGGKRKDGKGADTLAENWADTHNCPKIIYPPRYDIYDPRIAPLKRNTQIATESDFLLAFWNGSSHGTQDTMNKAWNMDKLSFVVSYQGIPSIYEPENY